MLLVHAPVMPEDGCAIVKAEMVPLAGRGSRERFRGAVYSAISTPPSGSVEGRETDDGEHFGVVAGVSAKIA